MTDEEFEAFSAKMAPAVGRAAKTISWTLNRLIGALPYTTSTPNALFQMTEPGAVDAAIAALVRELVPLQPTLMALLMENRDIREAYADAVSRIPARQGLTD